MARQRLLRDTDERRLVMDLENLRRLEMLETATGIEPDVDHPALGKPPLPRRPWQVSLLLLRRISHAGAVVQSVGRCLEPESWMSLRYVKRSGILDRERDLGIEDPPVDWVAGELLTSLNEARDRIVELAGDFRLLPYQIVDVVYAHVPWAELVPLASLAMVLSDPRLIDRLILASPGAAAHFDRVRRRGGPRKHGWRR